VWRAGALLARTGLVLVPLAAGIAGLAALAEAPQSVARAQDDCESYDDPDAPCALADGDTLSAYIGSPGGRNYFWFGVPSPDMHVSIRLTDLPADYDLYLFSDQVADPAQPILSSVTPDTAPETIDAVLHDVGTYAIEVVDDPTVANAPDDPYTLTFGLQPAAAPTVEPTLLPTPAPIPTAAVALVSVPPVVGQTTNSAARLLRQAGLVVEVATVDAFSPAGLGTVATQDPPSAARVGPGSAVRLGVASGRVAIPRVRGKPAAEADAALRAAGFSIETRRRPDQSVASGFALGTSPGDGTVLPSGSPVELLISQGH
jgi:hypothetical protein